MRRHITHSTVRPLQCSDVDVAGTTTAYLDRDYFLRTAGAALEVEVLSARNIDDKLGVRGSGPPCLGGHHACERPTLLHLHITFIALHWLVGSLDNCYQYPAVHCQSQGCAGPRMRRFGCEYVASCLACGSYKSCH